MAVAKVQADQSEQCLWGNPFSGPRASNGISSTWGQSSPLIVPITVTLSPWVIMTRPGTNQEKETRKNFKMLLQFSGGEHNMLYRATEKEHWGQSEAERGNYRQVPY